MHKRKRNEFWFIFCHFWTRMNFLMMFLMFLIITVQENLKIEKKNIVFLTHCTFPTPLLSMQGHTVGLPPSPAGPSPAPPRWHSACGQRGQTRDLPTQIDLRGWNFVLTHLARQRTFWRVHTKGDNQWNPVTRSLEEETAPICSPPEMNTGTGLHSRSCWCKIHPKGGGGQPHVEGTEHTSSAAPAPPASSPLPLSAAPQPW